MWLFSKKKKINKLFKIYYYNPLHKKLKLIENE